MPQSPLCLEKELQHGNPLSAKSIMFYSLPPAGQKIDLNINQSKYDHFKNFRHIKFYSSGTEALSASIIACKKLKPHILLPEILLPAYSCPDLISAILYAGAKPVLIDLEIDRPWLSLKDLEFKITSQSLCVIAVNLFGMEERLSELKRITKTNNIFLIQDSAQLFQKQNVNNNFIGDFLVYSFGRGKPVSVLKGGCVLSKTKDNFKYLPFSSDNQISTSRFDKIRHTIKILAFNFLLNPRVFWIPQSLPFSGIGKTTFHKLDTISLADEFTIKIIYTNIDNYLTSKNQAKYISDLLQRINIDGIIDLPKVTSANFNNLNRYPLLVKNNYIREFLYKKLTKSGLGVTLMYQKALNNFPELSGLLGDDKNTPNAEDFSKSLITLPVHKGMKSYNLQKLEKILLESKHIYPDKKKPAS